MTKFICDSVLQYQNKHCIVTFNVFFCFFDEFEMEVSVLIVLNVTVIMLHNYGIVTKRST